MKVPIYNIRGTIVKVLEDQESQKAAKADIAKANKAEASQDKPKDIKDLLNEDT